MFPDFCIHLCEDFPKGVVVEDAGVREQVVDEARTLVQAQRVFALVAQQRAHVHRKVLLVGQWRDQGQRQAVVVRRFVQCRRQAIISTR